MFTGYSTTDSADVREILNFVADYPLHVNTTLTLDARSSDEN